VHGGLCANNPTHVPDRDRLKPSYWLSSLLALRLTGIAVFLAAISIALSSYLGWRNDEAAHRETAQTLERIHRLGAAAAALRGFNDLVRLGIDVDADLLATEAAKVRTRLRDARADTAEPAAGLLLERAALDWWIAASAALQRADKARPAVAAVEASQGERLLLAIEAEIERELLDVKQRLEGFSGASGLERLFAFAPAGLLALLIGWAVVSRIRSVVGTEPESLRRLTRSVAAGDFALALPATADRSSALGHLRAIAAELRQHVDRSSERLWVDQGMRVIRDSLQNDLTPPDLSRHLSRRLAEFLDAHACGVYQLGFVARSDSMIHDEVLLALGSHERQGEALPGVLNINSDQLGGADAAGVLPLESLPLLGAAHARIVDPAQARYLLAPLAIDGRPKGALVLRVDTPVHPRVATLAVPGCEAIAVAVESALNQRSLIDTLADSQRLNSLLRDNQEQLRLSNLRLQRQLEEANSVVSSMQSGLIVVDREGLIKDCNPALIRLTGLNRAQLVGRRPDVLFEAEERSLVGFLRSIRDRLSEVYSRQPDGLRERIAELPFACLVFEADGTIFSASQRMSRMMGYGFGELDGCPLTLLVSPEQLSSPEAWLRTLRIEADAEQIAQARSYALMRRDAQEILVEFALMPFAEGAGLSMLFARDQVDLPWSVLANATLDRLVEGHEESAVALIKGRGGKPVPVRVSTTFVDGGGDSFEQVVINVHDVSSLVHKSDEIREQNSLLERTMEAMQDGVMQIDSQGCVVSANPKALDLLGRPLERVLGEPLVDLMGGGAAAALVGSWVPDEHDEVVQRLHDHSPGGFWSTLLQIAEPVFVVDREHSIRFINPIAERLLGFDRGALLGKQLDRIFGTEALRTVQQHLQAVFKGDMRRALELPRIDLVRRNQAAITRSMTICCLQFEGMVGRTVFLLGAAIDEIKAELMRRVQNVEWSLPQPDGPDVPIALTIAPLRGVDGRIGGGVITLKDMREFKQKEAENLQMVRKMEQSQRLDAVGQLAAGVAHDFNNLLGVVQNHAELVEMKVGSESKAQRNIKAILQATSRARDIVIKLNGLGREKPEHAAPEAPFAILPIVEETRSLLLASLKGIEIVIETGAGAADLQVRGDNGGFQQVLVNLCVNSSHAIGERRDGRIIIRTIKGADERTVLVSVIDNGGGIKPDVLQRIFEPFFTTKEVGKGTGLGLAMVRSIITKMGGTIDCQSELGTGTTFTLTLPLCV